MNQHRDKPEGYSEWLKKEFEEHGGVKLPTASKIICSNPKCQKEFYPSDRCPFCGELTPRRRYEKTISNHRNHYYDDVKKWVII